MNNTSTPIPELTLSLTPDELDIVMSILAKQPWEAVNGVIQKLYGQANNQPIPQPESKSRKRKTSTPPTA